MKAIETILILLGYMVLVVPILYFLENMSSTKNFCKRLEKEQKKLSKLITGNPDATNLEQLQARLTKNQAVIDCIKQNIEVTNE